MLKIVRSLQNPVTKTLSQALGSRQLSFGVPSFYKGQLQTGKLSKTIAPKGARDFSVFSLFRDILIPPKKTVLDLALKICTTQDRVKKKNLLMRSCQDTKDQQPLAFQLIKLGEGEIVAKHLQLFNLSEETHQDLFLSIYERAGPSTLKLLSEFNFSEKTLEQILKSRSFYQTKHIHSIAENIDPAVIPEKARKLIALKILENCPEALSKSLPLFNLEEDSLNELIGKLAEISSVLRNDGAKDFVKLFEVLPLSQKTRKTIATLLLQVNPAILCENISSFGLSEESLKEAITESLKNLPDYRVAPLAKKFTLLPHIEEIKIDVILTLLNISPDALHKSFPSLLLSEDEKEELAFALLRLKGPSIYEFIKNVRIENLEARKTLAFELLKRSPLELIQNITHFQIEKDLEFVKTCGSKITQIDPKLLRTYASNIHIPRATLSAIIITYSQENPATLFSQEEHLLIFKKIAEYRNQNISLNLFEQLIQLNALTNPKYSSILKKLCPNKTKDSPLLTHAILPAIYISKWMEDSQRVKKEDPESEKILSDFLQSPSNRPLFRDQVKHALMQNFLLGSISLDEDTSLQPFEKLKLLAEIGKSDEVENNLATLSVLCRKKIGNLLLKEDFSTKTMTVILDELSSKTLVEDSYADIKNIPNILVAYDKTFGSSRIPNSLKTYELGLQKLNDPIVQKDHTRFVRSVLLGTFIEERYRTENNPTLKMIEENDPHIFYQWKKPISPRPLYDGQVLITETDDALTLFEAPTLGQRTCQSIQGSPLFNKCLISLCIDGSNRMLTAKDTSNTLIARRIIRILLDENNQPVLLLEPLYAKDLNLEIEEALEWAAIQKAQSLGVKLILLHPKTPRFFEYPKTKTLRYLGGSCAYSYSDSLGGVLAKGPIEVSANNFKEYR